MARAYAGTVMLEGTTLSEGRGTTRPLELFGAPDIDARERHRGDARARAAMARRLPAARVLVRADVPQACRASFATACRSTPKVRATITQAFRPWRIQALAFKAIRRCYPDYPLWRDFAYEYEHGRLAIDVINGSPLLREWVDDASAKPQDLDTLAIKDEKAWSSERQAHLRY